MRTNYTQRMDGEAVIMPLRRGIVWWKTACCDCGLIHMLRYRVIDSKRLELTAWRDKRSTAQRRRWRHKK